MSLVVDARGKMGLALVRQGVFVAVATAGWQLDNLTAGLLIAMTAESVASYMCGLKTAEMLRWMGQSSDQDLNALKKTSCTELVEKSEEQTASPLMRAAAAMIVGHEHGGSPDREAIVLAVLSDVTGAVDSLLGQSKNASRYGLAGTATGLIILYSGLEVGGNADEFAATVQLAVGGMKMAVVTTLLGVMLEHLLENQHDPIDCELRKLESQLNAQLSLMKLGDQS